MLRKLIHGWEKNRYLTRYNTLSTLEQIARDNNDAENLLKYTSKDAGDPAPGNELSRTRPRPRRTR